MVTYHKYLQGEETMLQNSYMSLLSESEIKKIHAASIKILGTTGMMFDDERILKALEAKGAVVDYAKSIVKFPEKLLNETVDAIREDYTKEDTFSFYRDGDYETGYHWCGGPAVYFFDYENQSLREGTESDALSIINLANGSEHIKYVSNTMLVYNTERDGSTFDPKLWTIKTTALTLKNTPKFSFSENIHSLQELKYIRQMGDVVFEDPEELKKRPVFATCKCAISPLKLEKNACDILYYLAENDFMCGFCSMPISGATAPVTLAGTIALANAEILALWAAMKAVKPTTKGYFVPWLTIMDMKSGNVSYGAPESIQMNIGFQEICRTIYNVKPYLNSLYTDGKLPGIQSTMERTVYNMSSIAFGMNSFDGFGWLDRSQIISLEQSVIDLERAAWMEKFCKGITVTDETLALDVIERVGIGGNYLDDMHTAENFRNEFWTPEITDRAASLDFSMESYMESDMMKLANKKIKTILKNAEPYSLDKYKADEIDRIVKEAEENKFLYG